MDANVPVPGWNAHRHPQAPLRPPNYVMKDVPKCAKDLKGSVLQEVKDHEHFKETMAEMVLLCTEAMRRASVNRCSSKPLSLEYIADRLDVDDPCFGYFVRTPEGMLQGFITATTFTNWQKSFRWDSLHELAFYYDDSDSEEEEDVRHQPRKERKVDRDGSLARELAQTVRLGDPYNEGIVWPRVAEISLLGGLGCGKRLVQLVIEQLEFQKATASANYDYIALQATDNSIPFYESLGFVRVGAVTVQPEPKEAERADSPVSVASEESAATAEPLPPCSPEKPEVLAMPSDIVSGPLTQYEVRRPGETPSYVAKRLKVNVWDIIFLNKDIYKDIMPSSYLMKGTILHVPLESEVQQSTNISPTKWFVAKENDTPRKIARKFGLSCKKLVDANKRRMPELIATSRLREGTRVKVSNLDQHDDVCNPYCHWSFPDDSSVEGGEPSYMMVYKLDRKTARHPREIRNSLAVPIKQYSPPQLLLPRPAVQSNGRHSQPPQPPAEPLLAVQIFKNHLRDLYPELSDASQENEEVLEERWNKLSRTKKERYNNLSLDTRKDYERAYKQYAAEYAKWEQQVGTNLPRAVFEKNSNLFNKVVRLKDTALEGKEYSYWFVLTYIPDLKWCHLAPMVQDGVFGPEQKRSNGRPRWRLVDESLGMELDTSSTYCVPVKSRTLKKTADADKEEWDIMDGATTHLMSKDVPTGVSSSSESRPIRKQPVRARTAIKPMGGGSLAVLKPIQSPAVEQEQIQKARSPGSTSTRRAVSPRRSPKRSPRRRIIASAEIEAAQSPARSARKVSSPRRSPKRSPRRRIIASAEIEAAHSPARSARKVGSPRRSPKRSPRRRILSTEEQNETISRRRSTPPRVSPRWKSPSKKREAPSDMGPKRKARKLSNSGSGRCALQQQSIKGWLHRSKPVDK